MLSLKHGDPIAVIYNIKTNFGNRKEDKENFIYVKLDTQTTTPVPYNDGIVEIDSTGQNLRILHKDLELQPIPNTSKDSPFNDLLLCYGRTGAGKTTFMAKWAQHYRYMYGKANKIYLFSRHQKDESIDHIKPTRVEITNELIDDPIDLPELKNSLVIFDDLKSSTEPTLLKQVAILREDICENGRKYGISAAYSLHRTDYMYTRSCIGEATNLVIFPRGGICGLEYLLKDKYRLNRKLITKITSPKIGHWVLINLRYPNYYMSPKTVVLLNDGVESKI